VCIHTQGHAGLTCHVLAITRAKTQKHTMLNSQMFTIFFICKAVVKRSRVENEILIIYPSVKCSVIVVCVFLRAG